MSHASSASTLPGPWAYKGTFFPDFAVMRRYNRSQTMDAHADTGLYGRCLSATVSLPNAHYLSFVNVSICMSM